MPIAKAQLEMFAVPRSDVNIDWMVNQLRGNDWLTAAQFLRLAGLPDTDANKRWLRALAQASAGRIAGGQLGYKLVTEMTREEFAHWRAWMKSQADEMTRRILEADRVFYARVGVTTGNGILEAP